MKEYFKFFRWIYITLVIFLAIFLAIRGFHYFDSRMEHYERTNTECATTRRVFDNADVLSDKEEKKLAKLIEKRQAQTNCDIVLVTLNEPLREYAEAIEPDAFSDEYVRVYAEQFYADNKFGYDEADGDGIILVDNWSRADDGMIHTWLLSKGIVEDIFSYKDLDHILDRVYEYVENNPYRAYKTYINDFYDDMRGNRLFHTNAPGFLPIIVGVIASIIFIAVNWKAKSGVNTTTPVTYVSGKRADFVNAQDIFIRRSVTQHRIQSSSSSGGHGGGHHGGGSHGGRGHSR